MTVGLLSVANSGDAYSAIDGSLSGPVGGDVQHPTFYTGYAAQSGQVFTVRPPWKVAATDYPIGIPAASFPLKDPSNQSLLPAGATYAGGIVTVASVANPTFDGFDFGLHGGIPIDVKSSVTGILTLDNCNIVNGSASAALADYFVQIEGGAANIAVNNCVIDMNAPNFPLEPQVAFGNQGTGSFTGSYNAWLNICGQGGQSGIGATLHKYSYFEGINFDSPAHGEFTIQNGNGQGVSIGPIQFLFCTALAPAAFGGGYTALFYLSSAAPPGCSIVSVEVGYCTLVANYYQFQGYISGTVLTVTNAGTTANSASIGTGGTTAFTGPGVTSGTTITSNGTGVGGAGTYNVNHSQTVGSAGSPVTFKMKVGEALLAVAYDNIGTIDIHDCYVDYGGALQQDVIFDNGGGGTRPTPMVSGCVNLVTGLSDNSHG